MNFHTERFLLGQPVGYRDWWAKVSGNLGGIYPFYDLDAPGFYSLDIGEIINRRRQRGDVVELDPVGLACKTVSFYLLGDRTLVGNIRRAPWMAHLREDGCWEPAELPVHGRSRPTPSEFTRQLKQALLEEVASYVDNADNVGILLSGGMDSRITAGVLRQLQLLGEGPKNVVALTWGMEGSRDVVYSRQIVKRLGWEMIHFPLDPQTLAQNIEIASLAGAEVSPLHFHAIHQIAELKGIDVVLAGSYGDSVGRAEFSGRKLTHLKPILPRRIDQFGLLRARALQSVTAALREDATSSPHLSDVKDTLRRCEIEQEMHYMRRMLQSCMLLIAGQIPFYQMFTSPRVFGLMWELDPAIRNDSWYSHLLAELPGNLMEIPWARTGKCYGNSSQQSDDLSALNHNYGTWLRGDLRETILGYANSDVIRSLGIFNERGLYNVMKVWQRATTRTTNSLDEFMSWLAALHCFIERYDLRTYTLYEPSRRDVLAAIRGRIYAEAYVRARNVARE